MTENEIFRNLFYMLIDSGKSTFFNIEFVADGQTLTAYDGRYHVRLENDRELETYLYYILKGEKTK